MSLTQYLAGVEPDTSAVHFATPAQRAAVAQVQKELGWIGTFEQHVVAGFVVSAPKLQREVIAELRERWGDSPMADALERLISTTA